MIWISGDWKKTSFLLFLSSVVAAAKEVSSFQLLLVLLALAIFCFRELRKSYLEASFPELLGTFYCFT